MTGKLNFYVNAVDDLLKQGDDNSRIKDMLPTQEQLKERMTLLQRQLRETKRLLEKSKKQGT